MLAMRVAGLRASVLCRVRMGTHCDSTCRNPAVSAQPQSWGPVPHSLWVGLPSVFGCFRCVQFTF